MDLSRCGDKALRGPIRVQTSNGPKRQPTYSLRLRAAVNPSFWVPRRIPVPIYWPDGLCTSYLYAGIEVASMDLPGPGMDVPELLLARWLPGEEKDVIQYVITGPNVSDCQWSHHLQCNFMCFKVGCTKESSCMRGLTRQCKSHAPLHRLVLSY